MSTGEAVCPYCQKTCYLEESDLHEYTGVWGGAMRCYGCRNYFLVRASVVVDAAEELPLDRR